MGFDIMAIIQQYAVIEVAAVCFILGYLLKHTFAGFPDEFIPLLLGAVAIVAALWMNGWSVTPENILKGICSAALAVYAHQNGKQISEAMNAKKDDEKPGGGLDE